MATALRMNSMVVSEEQTFKLDNVCGSVHMTQKVTLGPLGPQKVTLKAHKEGEHNFCAVPGYTFLKPGLDRVKVMIKNLTARTSKVQQGSKIASMKAANAVPHLLAPQGSAPLPAENRIMKGTNIEIPQQDLSMTNNEGTEQCTTSMCTDDVGPSGNPIEVAASKPEVDRTPLPPDQMKLLFEQTKFEEGTSTWTEEQQKEVWKVIEKYSFLFVMNSLDLSRTDLVKHHIQLDNYTPFKDRYHRIPPPPSIRRSEKASKRDAQYWSNQMLQQFLGKPCGACS